jgi:hypothetical protein
MVTRFRIAYVAIPLALLALLVASFVVHPALPEGTAQQAIDAKDYGHIRAYDGEWYITLAPNSDVNLHRWELGLGRPMFTSAGLAVSNDGKNFYPLEGKPMGQCRYHWRGLGLNAVVAIGKCVPGWASVTGDPANHHAAEWIRLENLTPRPRVVLLKYDPLP